jgi:hypothetical protein
MPVYQAKQVGRRTLREAPRRFLLFPTGRPQQDFLPRRLGVLCDTCTACRLDLDLATGHWCWYNSSEDVIPGTKTPELVLQQLRGASLLWVCQEFRCGPMDRPLNCQSCIKFMR